MGEDRSARLLRDHVRRDTGLGDLQECGWAPRGPVEACHLPGLDYWVWHCVGGCAYWMLRDMEGDSQNPCHCPGCGKALPELEDRLCGDPRHPADCRPSWHAKVDDAQGHQQPHPGAPRARGVGGDD